MGFITPMLYVVSFCEGYCVFAYCTVQIIRGMVQYLNAQYMSTLNQMNYHQGGRKVQQSQFTTDLSKRGWGDTWTEIQTHGRRGRVRSFSARGLGAGGEHDGAVGENGKRAFDSSRPLLDGWSSTFFIQHFFILSTNNT